jgi:hypothetical protein
MVKFLFDVPVYVHSGLGTITFESDAYLGVGALGGIDGLEETEALIPAPISLSLDGLKSEFFDEALNAANYGDKTTLYWGYRDDPGDLIDEPWVMYRGRVETSKVVRGLQNTVRIVVQHELAVLNKKTNTKYTNEEQQRRYPGDNAFARIEQMSTVQLSWGRNDEFQGGGGRPVGPGPGGGDEPAEEAR